MYLHFDDAGSGMSGGVCTFSGFGVLLGRGWYSGSCQLGVSFGGGFGISKIVGTALWINLFFIAGFINWLSSKWLAQTVYCLVSFSVE